MVFWLSVIVFIAGIMTYMFFPRNDMYQQDMYQQEGDIVSFVNQHQVAKDLMYQLIQWKADDPTASGLYAFSSKQIANQRPEEADLISWKHVADGTTSPDSGKYTSAIACLESCTGGSDCIEGKKMTTCPSREQYVLTYGYMPEGQGSKPQNFAWFKAMLKRTHGSVACGLMYKRDNFYVLDNSQKYIGYQTIGGKRYLPPALTQKLQTTSLSTCSGCEDPLQDIMLCITPFQNPYVGFPPVFWWDIRNTTGTGYASNIHDRGTPLKGELQDDTWTALSTYSIAGTVQGNGNASSDLFRLNKNTVLNETCEDEACTLSVKQDENDLISMTVPNNQGYAFIYTGNDTKQTLTVYYTVPGEPFTKHSTESNLALPSLSAPEFLDIAGSTSASYLTSIRIYGGALTTREINHNIKADKKRFGL